MTLQQIRYVVTVAETGNITEAARKLFLSQPSLTNAVRDLEKELGITIFQRTNKGVLLSAEGEEFLAYARQIMEQVSLVDEKYHGETNRNPKFAVSCQHYSFAVHAFADVVRAYDANAYDFTLRETQTHEIIEDVLHGKSEIGILYFSSKNEEVLQKEIRKQNLVFEELFTAKPHVFISKKHPLASQEIISLEELDPYPYLTFEQGDYNSFYYAEEVVSTLDCRKNIKVRDRATLFNLVIGLNGFTVSSGVINQEFNGENIIAKPLALDEYMKVGILTQKNRILSRYGTAYLEALQNYI